MEKYSTIEALSALKNAHLNCTVVNSQSFSTLLEFVILSEKSPYFIYTPNGRDSSLAALAQNDICFDCANAALRNRPSRPHGKDRMSGRLDNVPALHNLVKTQVRPGIPVKFNGNGVHAIQP